MRNKQERAILYCLDRPHSPIAEAYRTLRTNILYASTNHLIRSLLVTSSLQGEGKSSTASNLAVAMAQGGKRVILVDGDLRNPTIHKCFFLSNDQGLTDLYLGNLPLEAVIKPTDLPNLHVMTSGPKPVHPAELLGMPDTSALIEALKTEYDLVLIDSPPLLPVTDGQILASMADAVLLVIESGKSHKNDVKKAKALLDHMGANTIGAVLTNKKEKGMVYYH